MRRKSQGYLGPLTHKPPVYLQISGIFGARITCTFANLMDICKSHIYSGPKGALFLPILLRMSFVIKTTYDG